MFSLELFPSDEWPEENGGEGLFRVRISSWPAGGGAAAQRSGRISDGAGDRAPRLHPARESERPTGSGAERHVTEVWHCPVGKYSFLTRAAIGELVAALLNDGELPEEEPAPYLPEKAEVRVYLENRPFNETGHVRAPPYQKRDGRWYVQVWVHKRGATEFCCNDVTLRRVR